MFFSSGNWGIRNGVADIMVTSDGEWLHWSNWQLAVAKAIYLNYLLAKTDRNFIRANKASLESVVHMMRSHLIDLGTHLQLMPSSPWEGLIS